MMISNQIQKKNILVVGNLLVGDADVIKIFQNLSSFAQGKTKINMEGQA